MMKKMKVRGIYASLKECVVTASRLTSRTDDTEQTTAVADGRIRSNTRGFLSFNLRDSSSNNSAIGLALRFGLP